jgi:multicomponent Na+:H+ antiporter subunit D
MNALSTLPLMIPLAGAAAALAVSRNVPLQRIIALISAAALLAVSTALLAEAWGREAVLVTLGDWPQPFAINLRVDALSAVLVFLTALLGLAVLWYSDHDIDERRLHWGYYPLVLFMLMGVSGAFLTADIFNLYVWFEVMLAASFVLITLGSDRPQLRGGISYVAVNLLGSVLFLTAVGLIYGSTRTLELEELALRLAALKEIQPGLVIAIQAMLLTAFAVKAAMFPLFYWLPASYHTPPPAISALFAGLLTKVGVYAMMRIIFGVFPVEPGVYAVLGVGAALTMITGVFGALAQMDVRRILLVHIVSQIGYLVAGVALAGGVPYEQQVLALTAGIFYTVHIIIVKTNLLLISGIILRREGTEAIKDLGGLAKHAPWLGIVFIMSALSLAGLPPFSGFWAKLAIIDAALAIENVLIAVFAVTTGLFTLMSMMKIWTGVFWGVRPETAPETPPRTPAAFAVPVIALTVVTVVVGLYPQPLFDLCEQAAVQLVAMAAGGAPATEVLP